MSAKLKSLRLDTFLDKHPYLACALLCSAALFLSQPHQIAKGVQNATLGDYALIWQVPVFALLAVLVCAFAAFVKEKKASVYKGALYISAGLGAAFLMFRLFVWMGDSLRTVAMVIIALLLLLGFVLLHIKGKGYASVLLAACGLAFCGAFGVSYVLVGFTIVLYCLAVFTRDKLELKKSIGVYCTIIITAVAVALCCMAVTAPKEKVLITGLVLCFGLYLISSLRGNVKIPPIIMLLFGFGLIMRYVYVLDVDLPENQHDVFSYFSDYPRHNTYIKYIFDNWSFPEEKVYGNGAGLSQYYHPPLHHFLAAVWMKVQTALGITEFAAYENVQYLTTFYSTAMMVVAYKVFQEFKLKGLALYSAFAVIALHPTFFIFAGSVNNDPLTTLFLFLSVLYTIRWYRDKSFKNILILAFTIGLGMMTKLSGAMIAFGTGFVFLYALFTTKTGGFFENVKTLWKKFALFAVVCFPLGLWWPIRCKLKFDMPIGYVPALSSNDKMYLGERSIWERLTGAGSYKLTNVYPNLGLTDINGAPPASVEEKFYDYGIPPYIVKSSLFGEYFNAKIVSAMQNVFAYALVISVLVLIAISLFGLFMGVRSLLKVDERDGVVSKENVIPYIFLVIYYVFLVGSYAVFCFKYPHTCTMDFRYIVPTLLIGAVWTGLLVNRQRKWLKPVKVLLTVATVVFCFASIAFYSLSYMG